VIRPTALGWKALAFFALLVVAFFAAPYQNLYFLLLAFLSVLGALNVLWTVRNTSGVRAEVPDPGPFPAGATTPLRASIDAGPRRRLDLTVAVDLGTRGRVMLSAGVVRGVTDARGDVLPLPRGVHPVKAAWMESTYPLGLVRSRRTVRAPRDLVVHPAPASLPNVAGGGLAGVASALGGAAGADQPSGLRDFRNGDDVRSIHWRATARRGRPVVTEWDASAGDGLELVLDRRADEHALEEALSVVTALALAARDTKERLTIHTQGLSRTFGAGHADWDELLRFLAAADRLPSHAAPPPPAATTVLRLPQQHRRATA
jgi:uncharacterized protein (DUF58 family)